MSHPSIYELDIFPSHTGPQVEHRVKSGVEEAVFPEGVQELISHNLTLSPVPLGSSVKFNPPPTPNIPAVMEAAVVVPTLNERDNITLLIEKILQADPRLHAIVVDDGSPDGTAEIVAALAREHGARGTDRIHLIARGQRLGYASAVQDGMRLALQHGARLILQMDADFSHDPQYLGALLEKSENYDLVIGSRYVPGGGTRNWDLGRRVLSGSANALARLLLQLPARDCTGGFRCWHRDLIEKSGVLDVPVQGYAFLFVTLDRCRRAGARIGEVPIIFVDRRFGKSKMSRRIIMEAVRVLLSLWFQRVTRRENSTRDSPTPGKAV